MKCVSPLYSNILKPILKEPLVPDHGPVLDTVDISFCFEFFNAQIQYFIISEEVDRAMVDALPFNIEGLYRA